MTFVKRSTRVPPGFFALEAAGLAWLAESDGAHVVRVLEVHEDRLVLERLSSARPSPDAARAFGAGLARTHAAGAPEFGYTPGAAGRAWFGPMNAPFEVDAQGCAGFSEFWSRRLEKVTRLSEPVLDAGGFSTAPILEVIDLVRAGAFDGIAGVGTQSPSRVHGDLWAGNVMWTGIGGVLIDPAAHGGHRLEDLAMLELFGAPHLDEIFAGYESVYPMPAGWRKDLVAHSFFALLAHVYLFGGSYAAQSVHAAEQIVAAG